MPEAASQAETDITERILPSRKPGGHGSFWKTAAVILGVLGAAGTIAAAIGRAFYVTRTEYSDKILLDAVETTNVKNVLERLDRTMFEQKTAFEKLTGDVAGMKEDLTIIKARTRGN